MIYSRKGRTGKAPGRPSIEPLLTSEQIKQRNMFRYAKERANKQELPFSITVNDVETPSSCPVFGIKLCYTNSITKANSPSLDRIIPILGYTKENIVTISHRANTLKSNGSLENFKCLVKYLELAKYI